MLKRRSTVHEVAWQFNKLAYSSGVKFRRVIYKIALDHYSVGIGDPNTISLE